MSGSFGKRWALTKLVRFVTGFVFFNTAQGSAEVRFQHDAGEFAGRGRDPKRHVTFIPHATSLPALPKLVRFVTEFIFFKTALGTAEVRLQHDTGNLVGRGRDPECYVAFIPYATIL